MYKTAVIIFHKNIARYPERWWKLMCFTIREQTYKDFDVFELDYGGTGIQIYEGSNFESLEMPTHAHAHNHLLDKVFAAGYEVAFNCNLDDYYHETRIEKQLPLLQKYDVVSSNWRYMDVDGNLKDKKIFSGANIPYHFARGHNVIAHPACAYRKSFWENCSKLHPEQIPHDDFDLWKRELAKGATFYIHPDILLYYRLHPNNSGNK